jgi:hypothetical protein
VKSEYKKNKNQVGECIGRQKLIDEEEEKKLKFKY